MTRRAQSVLCIGCPTGCSGEVVIEDGVVVEMHGYTCKRGRAYVAEEVIAPKRMVTTTVRVSGGALALLPVVSDRPVPKESIFACLGQLRKVTVTAPVATDSVVLADVLGLGVNFVAARDCPTYGSPAWIEASQDGAPAPQSDPEELAASEALQVFNKQFDLLRKRLLNDPKSLRQVFIDDGTHAIVWEFQQDRLGADFTRTLWNLLLRDDDMSLILQRFIGALPLPLKCKFIAALDAHLSGRYPMFEGRSKDWPAESFIPAYVHPADVRSRDFDLVTMGHIGYRTLGYSPREVDLFAWLERLRNKRRDDGPAEVGPASPGQENAQARRPGGDPHPGHAEPVPYRRAGALRLS
jgi:CxxC motif-containing protein